MDWIPLILTPPAVLGCLASCTLNAAAIYAVARVERLDDVTPGTHRRPRLSVIIPACNEASTLASAAETLLACRYADLEVIFVNDRSTDATGEVMNALAAGDDRVRVHHVTELPAGWLGKVHALHCGTQCASGELLLYTDADVHFHPLALERAVDRMEAQKLDHLTVMPRVVPHGFAYGVVLSAFAILLLVGARAWRFRRPDSGAYTGVGAFGLVRRTALARSPGWEWLKMEVADDVGLGMLIVREAGGRSQLVIGTDSLHIDWYDGLRGLMAGLEKNLFGAACGYSIPRATAIIGGFLCIASGPPLLLMSLPLAPAALLPALLTLLALSIGLQAALAVSFTRIHLAVGPSLTTPAGFAILAVTLARSMRTVLRRGGVPWRGHLYPLDALRQGRRVDL